MAPTKFAPIYYTAAQPKTKAAIAVFKPTQLYNIAGFLTAA
jgi:hypothetical protein